MIALWSEFIIISIITTASMYSDINFYSLKLLLIIISYVLSILSLIHLLPLAFTTCTLYFMTNNFHLHHFYLWFYQLYLFCLLKLFTTLYNNHIFCKQYDISFWLEFTTFGSILIWLIFCSNIIIIYNPHIQNVSTP